MRTNLDITLRYKTLCSLAVSHDYFKDKEAKRLMIEPTLETKMWLRNNRLIYRPKGTGFTIGYLERDGGRIQNQKFDKEKMTFLISTTDVYFDTYSSYDFRRNSQVIYLNNEGKGDFLSQKEQVSNDDIMPCFPYKFIYKISDNDDNKKVIIKDYSMNDVWETSNNQLLQVNLAGNDLGKYQIKMGDQTIESFYLLPKVPRGAIAVVDIFLKDIPVQDEITYKVNFGAKAAIWRYYFVKYKSSSIYEKVRVESIKKGKELPFTSPQAVTIHSGQDAMMIESKEPIIVQENSPYRFQLKAFKKNTQERITVQLPNPTYREITVDKATKAVSANIFMKI